MIATEVPKTPLQRYYQGIAMTLDHLDKLSSLSHKLLCLAERI